MATMLRWLRENVDLPDDVDQLKIHFSGCTADCGQANTADIGLLGMRARKDGEMVEAVDIGVGGGMGESRPSSTTSSSGCRPTRPPSDPEPDRGRSRSAPGARPDVPRKWADATDTETLAALRARGDGLRRPVAHRREAVVVPVRRGGDDGESGSGLLG